MRHILLIGGAFYYWRQIGFNAVPADLVGIQVPFKAAAVGIHNGVLSHVGIVDHTVFAADRICFQGRQGSQSLPAVFSIMPQEYRT